MKLQWTVDAGRISTDDERSGFTAFATRFTDGTEYVSAAFELGRTYVAMTTERMVVLVVPEDGMAPEELFDHGMRLVRADKLLKVYFQVLREEERDG